MVEHPAALRQTYILCGPRYTTLDEPVAAVAKAVSRPVAAGRIPLAPVALADRICELVCKPLGLEPPLHRRRLDFFTKDRGFTSDKARREIGYSPEIELKKGAGLTADWYRERRLL